MKLKFLQIIADLWLCCGKLRGDYDERRAAALDITCIVKSSSEHKATVDYIKCL